MPKFGESGDSMNFKKKKEIWIPIISKENGSKIDQSTMKEDGMMITLIIYMMIFVHSTLIGHDLDSPNLKTFHLFKWVETKVNSANNDVRTKGKMENQI
ncbi:hypothetical protein C1645_829806 [Glomus cerebriforme]|uniref:Uncharacterized protein n=1 Tax=Glomus cerebriforme TaxID=658196 RepID=A0A397SIQ9_9GLOM|nr:hypothetical protein C1645_829806 [Glomus cerebriforme]